MVKSDHKTIICSFFFSFILPLLQTKVHVVKEHFNLSSVFEQSEKLLGLQLNNQYHGKNV